ncbi:KipI family sensor histidine kinase inhibitor [Dokdonia sp. Hel_I_63]|uniref:5-oxoprolinase subunit PxpB n=1 Tax=Dokdonia sp. Hel_I_63 TaxID=1249996 RepID=UPI00119A5342|nr:5-oxoprolinase subunit PxpB [Dokdonia sp. Hel_I_63]TVZ22441.1 KipI family sensor histidine kinase inhibitor [Dokdonia sp. Hel_I_63]
MCQYNFHISRLGDYSLLIQIESPPSQDLLNWLLIKKATLSKLLNVELVHTYNELLVKKCISKDTSIDALVHQISTVLNIPVLNSDYNSVLYKIPVCYSNRFAPDLKEYASQVKCTIPEIIEIHTSREYPIYFLGFLPGFPYLENLDDRLHLDRKSVPSRSIAKGSVAIGGTQTGIYPQDSPGGWHVIGRTPISLFDATKATPSLFKAGDIIKFYAISESDFEEIATSNNL